MVLLTVVAARPAPYVAFMPGSARDVEPLITIEANGSEDLPELDDIDNDLMFVTVSVRYPSGIEAIWRLLDDASDVVPSELILGSQSAEQNRSFNLQLMTASKDKATKVALERSGFTVKVEPSGAVIVNLDPTYPAAAVLVPGDTVVGADGIPVKSTDDLIAAIDKHGPGALIGLKIEKFGTGEVVEVKAELAENPEKEGKAQLGVSLENRPSYEFPIKVSIDSGDVGGPSAGLAFTLAIVDRLTPGNLTGGSKVAVTGTINLDGSVGPVGGVVQKTEAAVSAGATVFLVPPDEFADATRSARDRLEVRKVTNLDEALAALAELGGDPVPPASTLVSDN
ncbi:MAG: S16 family serine protease [Aquihabitans sp.]